MKRMAVLTSGADAPGMNAAIRAVVRSGIYNKIEMIGVKGGFEGILEERLESMDAASVGSIMQRGGTILQSSSCEKMFTEEGQKKAQSILHKYEIDSVVVIGGKEALQAAALLEKTGLACIGIPATIDNDVPGVTETIGFDTALNTVVDYMDRIRDTASSHEKTSIIEVMGKDTGNLALWAGLAGGAENILIPEKREDLHSIIEEIKQGGTREKRYRIIVVAEGMMSGAVLHEKLTKEAGIESRVTSLGHIQRGGAPTARDRIFASRLGAFAVDLLLEGKTGQLVTVQDRQLVNLSLEDTLEQRIEMDESVYQLPKKLSI
ncbi:ATP-dependent 6-phosphofructokinase [Halobacillus salinus]|uniref:ATP-dependent 6-phosphofructokinase n=1 Tax=Halobacillus salinus TaxID=192814 RepID=A0A4Z0GV19_9BACI|nr:ATP-dependent 6-phosphofructokinase [Halobacillus salinus]TGB01511.1 6-phosphofructokinase [Halobacillus salinus]